MTRFKPLNSVYCLNCHQWCAWRQRAAKFSGRSVYWCVARWGPHLDRLFGLIIRQIDDGGWCWLVPLTFGINCMKVSIDSESSKQSLQHTSEAEWAEKVEGKLRSGIRWLNQILWVVRFKALGNFPVWKRQRVTGRELRAMLWPSTQKHGKSNTWHRVRPLFLDEFYSLINTSLLWDAGKVILGNVTP